MSKIALFGHGFIGRELTRQFPDFYDPMPRDAIDTVAPQILYGISTTHNYHVKDGDPFIDINTNLVHFMKVLDASISEETVFNLISTWFVYGETDLPAREDSYCNPKGFYSITARAREQLLISYCDTFGLKYRILRLGNVIGVGDEKASLKKNALQWFIKEIALGNDIKIYKDASVRDYIDVRDCARAIHLVLEKGELNTIYNIANGQGLNVKDLIQTALRAGGFESNVTEMEVPEFHKVVQTRAMFLNVNKIKSLGYVQQHDIKTSIRELVSYYGN